MPRRFIRPLERFLELESGSAALLMVAAAVGLVWANVDEASYEQIWSAEFVAVAGPIEIEEDLRHVVNDLLMAVFFYVVALEIKRELLHGSLRDRRSAVVPTAAALGTIVGGAAAYVAVNLIADGDLRGWAIPAATDIAFALGVLGLAGRRAPNGARTFMLTLAIVDDVATIAIIGLFYTTELAVGWLAAAAAIAALIALLSRGAVRSLVVYVVLAAAMWYAVLRSGVHATIAGVVLGFLTPAAAFHRSGDVIAAIRERLDSADPADREELEAALDRTSRLAEEGVSPLARMEERLHPWSAYAVLPLFALANAGVSVSVSSLQDAVTGPVGVGIILGLVVGAPVGGILFALGAVRSRLGRFPNGLDSTGTAAVTPLKGIGFTVAIFIAALAFEDAAALEEAKLAILLGSLVSAVVGLACIAARDHVQRD